MLLSSCKNNKETQNNEEQPQEVEVSANLVDDPENEGEKMLLGLVTQEDFKNKTLFPWMYESFEEYKPEPAKVMELKKLLESVSIKVFMGTWCEDSQREIPQLYKILHTANFPMSDLTMVAVSHDKDTPNKLEEGYNIAYVPTIILMKDGKEIGRFVEYAQGDLLIDDLITILKGDPYTPAYSE